MKPTNRLMTLQNQNHDYEEPVASRNEAIFGEQEELEMMQNTAYGPLSSR
jgi:hypothetical protein